MLKKIVLGLCLCLLTAYLFLYQQDGTTSITYQYHPTSFDDILSPPERVEGLPPEASRCRSVEDSRVIKILENGEMRIVLSGLANNTRADIYYQLPDGSVYRRILHPRSTNPNEMGGIGYIETDLPGDWTVEEVHLVVVQGSTVLCPES